MTDYILSCCSTADMPYEYFTEKNIPFICFHYILDGQEYPDDLGKTIPLDTYYKKISEGAMPTTSQVNVAQYIAFFEPFLKEGKDILHISFSSGLSGSYNSATIARSELIDRYPERNIFIVDSLAASSGYGLFVDTLLDKKLEGMSINELHSYAEQTKSNIQHWILSTDLTHLKRGGRISSTSAAIGTLLNICPIINVNIEGKLIPRKKIRGKKQAIKEMVNMMEVHATDRLDYSRKCFISHSACFEDAQMVANLIEEKFKSLNGKVMINNIGTVIGAHTGPGTIALFFEGDKRTV